MKQNPRLKQIQKQKCILTDVEDFLVLFWSIFLCKESTAFPIFCDVMLRNG